MRQIYPVNNTSSHRQGRQGRSVKRVRRSVAALLAAAAAAGLGGCQADSWFDPSQMGYWENTPTTMPILDRIAAIEEKSPTFVETVPPAREDLIAEAQQYRLGPSDEVEVQIPNFEQVGYTSQYPRQVDQRGYLNIPRVGQVYVLGKTDLEAQEAIARVIQEAEILADPKVTLLVLSPQQLTFSMLGGVRSPGTYRVAKPDYRLLEAMAAAGGFDESTDTLYVVRQIPLSEAATGRTAPPPELPSTRDRTAPPPDPDDLFDEIKRLTEPPASSPTPPPSEPGGLSVVSRSGARSGERRAAPYTGLQPDARPEAPSAPQLSQPIDLIDSTDSTPARSSTTSQPMQTMEPAAGTSTTGGRARTRWVYLNGQWTREGSTAAATPAAPAGTTDPLPSGPIAADLLTQRVIEIPVKQLLAGQADVNIVIRPGDVIRVPVAASGVIYVGGQVARPGTFTMPPTGKLTLLRVIDAAGGMSQLGIPERVDLTRMVGPNREATIRLNMRAIAERTQPDVILKADDRINVGTNFWAFPLAIIRNGFRMSYGFGFLIDRNFGNDIFGAPPGSLGE